MIEVILTSPDKKIIFIKAKNFKKIQKNKNLIIDVSLSKNNEINRLARKLNKKKNIYFLLNLSHDSLPSRIKKIFYTFLIVRKNPIIINNHYINSFIPDFLHKYKINSLLNSLLYFCFQILKNLISIFFSKKLIFKL